MTTKFSGVYRPDDFSTAKAKGETEIVRTGGLPLPRSFTTNVAVGKSAAPTVRSVLRAEITFTKDEVETAEHFGIDLEKIAALRAQQAGASSSRPKFGDDELAVAARFGIDLDKIAQYRARSSAVTKNKDGTVTVRR
jgi:hypothetical protein